MRLGAVPKVEKHNTYDLSEGLLQLFNQDKRLRAIIRSGQHDHLGVAPLKEGNITSLDPMQKENILNREFISVFTDDTKTTLPEVGPSPSPRMVDIDVSCEGVVKPLMKLKPHKAAGPDDIHLMQLKEAAD